MKPLEGIRVVDFTQAMAAPYCTMNLADLGADVIKLERPGRGDDMRWLRGGAGMSAIFAAVNRNKRGVAVDLRHDAHDRGIGIEDAAPGPAGGFLRQLGAVELAVPAPQLAPGGFVRGQGGADGAGRRHAPIVPGHGRVRTACAPDATAPPILPASGPQRHLQHLVAILDGALDAQCIAR